MDFYITIIIIIMMIIIIIVKLPLVASSELVYYPGVVFCK